MQPLTLKLPQDEGLREATANEIFSYARDLLLQKFPQPIFLRGRADVLDFVNSYMPSSSPSYTLIIALGSDGSIVQYEVVESRELETLVERLGGYTVGGPLSSIKQTWIVRVRAESDKGQQQLLSETQHAELAMRSGGTMHFFEVDVGPRPRIQPSEGSTAFYVVEGLQRRHATVAEVIKTALTLNVRTFERGQVLPNDALVMEQAALCVAPLVRPALGVMLLDSQRRFRHYYKLRDTLGMPPDSGCELLYVRGWHPASAIAISAQVEPLQPLSDQEALSFANLLRDLSKNHAVVSEGVVFVGSDDVQLYSMQLTRKSSRSAVTAQPRPLLRDA